MKKQIMILADSNELPYGSDENINILVTHSDAFSFLAAA